MSYSDPDLPEFDETAIGGDNRGDDSNDNSGKKEFDGSDDTTDTPVEIVVKSNLNELRGGVDGFFDTLLKVENGDISEDFGEDAMNRMLKQIQQSREMLAGIGVRLPNQNVNYDTTTSDERMHELGCWVYSHYEDEYQWRQKLRNTN
jgi:hypothetical protein